MRVLSSNIITLILFLLAGSAHALTLVAVDDSFGVPFAKTLQVEALGVLENDTQDGNPVEENGATAELLSSVANGTLTCPTDAALQLCADGSFDYTPGPGFSGSDSFTYRAVFGASYSAPATVTLTACMGGPDIFSCWLESSYLSKLTELGYGTFLESFEGTAWDTARSPDSAAEIISQGISWTSNHQGTNNITTGEGPALNGQYGGYDPDHGFATGSEVECNVDTPPEHCLFHDGLSGKILPVGSALQGAGAYITGFTGANIAIVLDGMTQITIGKLPDPGFYFFAVIDATATGFNSFQFRELDGKVGQARYIFGDDFIIASSGILPGNTAPLADAGTDQTALVGGMVTLDGSGSTDADGDALTYSWSLTSQPAGSIATLSDPTAINPTFVVDVAGTYVVQLIVNDGLLDSLPDTASITTDNSAPLANAGADQTALVGDTVTLDGSGSSDADGDALTYSWLLTSQPAGSTATLTNPTAVKPTFVVDVAGTYAAQLIVNDGLLDSLPDTAGITTDNSAPLANAGADQTALVGDTVTLDGSGSSDVDGDALTYSWSLTSQPTGSTATLTNPTAVNPTFVVDVADTYVVQLIVNDSLLDSAPDTVTITSDNSVPIANAGVDQTALVGDTVTLDGSGSTDVDGDALSYSWSLTMPAGSSATLSDPLTVNPGFIVDLPGTYVAQLIVNDGLLDSAADTVSISTENSAPVADAGLDQSTLVGNTVTLDGSASSDADWDVLTHSWSLSSVPAGSTAALSDPTAVNPAFVVDLPGTYVAQLIVNDGLLDSTPDTVSISTENSAPVADAGANQTALVGDSVTLDGSASSDADWNALTYSWSLSSVPAGSTAALSDPTAVNPAFVADLPGTYIAQLIVNDGLLDSAADTVNISISISTINTAPVADAAMELSSLLANTVLLDGSASSDADGDTLTYSWSLSRPAGSMAMLSDPTAVNPTFIVDLPGTYVVQLIVNDGLLDSAADENTLTRSCSSNPVVIENIQYNTNVSEQSQISISTNANSVVVENAVSVSYQAPAITLKPGFHAKAGSQFTAISMSVSCVL